MQPILEIRDALRVFKTPEGGNIRALDGISLDVAANEFVTLLGPSGCGKTTLLRAIAGFEDLDDGTILVDGQNMTNVPAHRRPVNTVFQSYALFSHMSVKRNVAYALEVSGIAKDKRNRRADELLELVGLDGMGSRKPTQLSGGQRQRVALARALISRPKILLLDEPLSALDRQLRQQMQIELKALQHDVGISFVFVTHDQEESLAMSDRVVVIKSGKIEQIGSPREIYRKPNTRFVAGFIGETNMIDVTLDGKGKAISAQGYVVNHTEGATTGKAIVVLRPSEVSFVDPNNAPTHAIPGIVKQEIYLGAELHYLVTQDAGADTWRVTARDDDTRHSVGDKVCMTYDPSSVHLIQEG